MARIYGKVSMETWGDDKFCSLSPLKPSGQALWLYLLTGRFRTSIPGLNLNVGVGALSDRLAWKARDIEKHWGEIESKGMASADWRHGVIWLPKAIEHNEPESPNVIKGWGKLVLPECELVTAALESLRGYITLHLSEAYTKAFRDTFREVSRNQEQEQEQEEDPQTPASAGAVKVVRQDRAEAKHIREVARRCEHEPLCETFTICIERIAVEIARKRQQIRIAS